MLSLWFTFKGANIVFFFFFVDTRVFLCWCSSKPVWFYKKFDRCQDSFRVGYTFLGMLFLMGVKIYVLQYYMASFMEI